MSIFYIFLQVVHVRLLLSMATPALALCTNLTVDTIEEVIFITIATVAIVSTEVVPVEHVRVMVPGRGMLSFV